MGFKVLPSLYLSVVFTLLYSHSYWWLDWHNWLRVVGHSLVTLVTFCSSLATNRNSLSRPVHHYIITHTPHTLTITTPLFVALLLFSAFSPLLFLNQHRGISFDFIQRWFYPLATFFFTSSFLLIGCFGSITLLRLHKANSHKSILRTTFTLLRIFNPSVFTFTFIGLKGRLDLTLFLHTQRLIYESLKRHIPKSIPFHFLQDSAKHLLFLFWTKRLIYPILIHSTRSIILLVLSWGFDQ